MCLWWEALNWGYIREGGWLVIFGEGLTTRGIGVRCLQCAVGLQRDIVYSNFNIYVSTMFSL